MWVIERITHPSNRPLPQSLHPGVTRFTSSGVADCQRYRLYSHPPTFQSAFASAARGSCGFRSPNSTNSQPLGKLRRCERLRSVMPRRCRRSGSPIGRSLAGRRPSSVRGTKGSHPKATPPQRPGHRISSICLPSGVWAPCATIRRFLLHPLRNHVHGRTLIRHHLQVLLPSCDS